MNLFLLAALFSLAWAGILGIAAKGLEKRLPHLAAAPEFYLALLGSALLPLLLFLPGLCDAGLPLMALAEQTPLPAVARTIITALDLEPSDGVLLANERHAWHGPAATSAMAALVAGTVVRLAGLARDWRRLSRIAAKATPFASARPCPWPVRLTNEATAPFAIGFQRAIVLPRPLLESSTKPQIDMVIAHEEAHLRARDPEVAACLALISALFWFNPFLRRLTTSWRQAAELRADRIVLTGAPTEMRRDYATALLASLRIAAGRALPCPPASFSTLGLRNEKMRIAHILEGGSETGKGRRAGAFLAVALLAGIGSGLAITASTAAGTDDVRIVKGRLAVSFGIIRADGTFHRGVDIAAPAGTPVRAPEDMVVIEASDALHGEARYGKGVELQAADGTRALFAHLDSYLVKTGDRLAKGEAFATVGMSGANANRPHLHLEAFQDRKRVDPLSLWPELER